VPTVTEILDDETQGLLRTLIASRGLDGAAEALGLNPVTLSRIALGQPGARATVRLVSAQAPGLIPKRTAVRRSPKSANQ
jgi:hypothetical protein